MAATVATIAALLFSGCVQAVISPPLNWLALHPIAWTPAFRVFSRLAGRRAFLAGWLVGVSANLAIFQWLPGTISRYGGLPWPVAFLASLLFAAAFGLYAALVGWGFRHVRRAGGARWPFAVAACFCALEFLNPQLFGYLQGVAWYQTPKLFLVSALTGLSGVSFLVIAFNAIALQGYEVFSGERPGERRDLARNAAALGALVLASLAYSSFRLSAIAKAEREVEPVRVAIVQPNHTIERRFELARAGRDAFARDMVAQSREAYAADAGNIDVFVWPEGALRSDPGQPENATTLALARETGAEIWAGASHHGFSADGAAVAHNSAYRVLSDGRIDRRYDKNVLVPFGEYVPLAGVFPALNKIPTVANFEPGTEVPTYVADGTRFVFLICYEAIRSGFVRSAAASGANLLVNVTVDAWYGDTSEQSQHLMLAAAQSALLGMPLVRATTTGISAFVDARGLIRQAADNYTQETLLADVRPLRLPGLYGVAGDWFAWLCVGITLAALRKAFVNRGR